MSNSSAPHGANPPVTVERIRQACLNDLDKCFKKIAFSFVKIDAPEKRSDMDKLDRRKAFKMLAQIQAAATMALGDLNALDCIGLVPQSAPADDLPDIVDLSDDATGEGLGRKGGAS